MLRKSEVPTIRPEFDVDGFAKDSDTMLVAALATPESASPIAQSETRLATRPARGAVTDEGWACTVTGNLIVTMSIDELKRMPLDHRAGYLLFWMDGSIDLGTLVDVSSMARDEVLGIVRDLYESGIVAFR